MHAASLERERPHPRAIYAGSPPSWSHAVRTVFTCCVAVFLTSVACSRAREYELQGQVLAVDRARREITIKHGDIRGFMPGMTMPFHAKDAKLLDCCQPGDLVRARLVVEDATGYLAAIERTGHAPLAETTPATPMDVLDPGEPVPDIQLTDETGRRRRLAEWRGKVLAVTFTYTRCPLPDFCPRMDEQFKSVQSSVLADAGLRDRVALLSISFDPAFDTPTILEAHARRVGADPLIWHFATGEQHEIDAFASRFGVLIIREPSNPSDITHNLRTAVVDSRGRLREILNGTGWAPEELLAALRQAQ
jgi:protein SCO1